MPLHVSGDSPLTTLPFSLTMATNSQNCDEAICLSEVETNPKTSQGNPSTSLLPNSSSTIEMISKAVQNQLSAILPNMIHELTKSTHIERDQSELSHNPRLAAGSTQGLNKRTHSRLAAGSTQGAIEQIEQSSDDEVQEITNEGEREPPLKKANMSLSGDFSDIDEVTASPGRWAASEELSSLLNVLFINKNLSSYERNQITKEFPRPDVHSVYTPVLDNYLSSLITGAKGVDKESKRLQDQILDVVGPIAMALEHVSSLQSSLQEGTESINIPSSDVNGLYTCLTKALCLLGSLNSQLSLERRK